MARHYQANEGDINVISRGNGVTYGYNEKTGEKGRFYSDGHGRCDFYPDPPEKQPGCRPPREEPPPRQQASGPSEYDQMIGKMGDEINKAFGGGIKEFGGILAGLFGALVSGLALGTFMSALSDDPNDVGKAASRAGRVVLCAFGILADIIVLAVLVVLDAATVDGWGPVGRTVLTILELFGCYAVIGLVRVAMGKPFWINLGKIWRTIRSVKLPKIAYVGIELLTIALVTKPVLMWLNSFTIDWVSANQENIPQSLVFGIAGGMLLISLVVAAAAGIVVCKLVRLITAG